MTVLGRSPPCDFMKIEIRKKGGNTAILITFQINSNKFENLSERSRFFEELYGRKQIIRREKKIYEYHREGLLNSMNHLKVDNSVFIIAMQNMQRMMQFFNEWEDKVQFKTFPVLLNEEEIEKLKKQKEIKIEGG